ncbi:MAG: AAA family ATPase [Bacteroidota bacterium]
MHTQPPRIRTGTSQFSQLLLKSDVFVDKSLFIQEFLEGEGIVSLITRPRRWGKSLNMDMLKRFLSIEMDKQGKPVPQEKSLHRKLFTGGEVELDSGDTKLLQPLKISNCLASMKHQGQYPVISLGFKDVKGSSYAEIEAGVKTQITKLYGNHAYLEQHLALETIRARAQKEKLCRYIMGEFDRDDLSTSLLFLSELLKERFDKPVYVLIDEYDTPINSAYLRFQDRPGEFEKVLELFRDLFGATLKDNPHLEQGLITGILRIAKANLFSDLNNVREYTLLDEKFATCYGFTQREVDELLDKVPISTTSDEIRHWYNGYNFGDQVLYNPWSIMCCLSSKGQLDHYWLDSGGTNLIDSVLLSDKIQKDLQTLISGNSICSSIMKQISFDDIQETEGLYSLLLFSGYLKIDVDRASPDPDTYYLLIPNYEVGYMYRQRLIKWISKKLEIDSRDYHSLMSLLASGQVSAFADQLQTLLDASTSFYQTGSEHAELFYSGFMLGLLHTLHYTLASEWESGMGRPDFMLIPQSQYGDQALILEYKVSPKVRGLTSLAAKGLIQIADKGYKASLKSHGHIRQALQVCLAFCGKKVAVKYAQVTL